jgi:hypothetical protein
MRYLHHTRDPAPTLEQLCRRRIRTRLGAGASLFAALWLGGCSAVNWQATYDAWAASLCREDRSACRDVE